VTPASSGQAVQHQDRPERGQGVEHGELHQQAAPPGDPPDSIERALEGGEQDERDRQRHQHAPGAEVGDVDPLGEDHAVDGHLGGALGLGDQRAEQLLEESRARVLIHQADEEQGHPEERHGRQQGLHGQLGRHAGAVVLDEPASEHEEGQQPHPPAPGGGGLWRIGHDALAGGLDPLAEASEPPCPSTRGDGSVGILGIAQIVELVVERQIDGGDVRIDGLGDGGRRVGAVLGVRVRGEIGEVLGIRVYDRGEIGKVLGVGIHEPGDGELLGP